MRVNYIFQIVSDRANWNCYIKVVEKSGLQRFQCDVTVVFDYAIIVSVCDSLNASLDSLYPVLRCLVIDFQWHGSCVRISFVYPCWHLPLMSSWYPDFSWLLLSEKRILFENILKLIKLETYCYCRKDFNYLPFISSSDSCDVLSVIFSQLLVLDLLLLLLDLRWSFMDQMLDNGQHFWRWIDNVKPVRKSVRGVRS